MVIDDLEQTLYHGGRELEYSYQEIKGNKSKQMEYGPGLYLTANLDIARSYAKGGGRVYKVTIFKGTEIGDIELPLETIMDFIKFTRLLHKSELVNFIKEKYKEKMKLIYFLNLLVNFECMTSGNSAKIRQFFVDCGADYHVTTFKGSEMVVVFNPKIIKSVQKI